MATLLEMAIKHRDQDSLVAGTYGTDADGVFKGCSVGCFIHDIFPQKSAEEIQDMNGKHKILANFGGYPEWVVHLQDSIFEGLSSDERKDWHVNIYKALDELPSGFDWGKANHKINIGILKIALRSAGSARGEVQAVLGLHERSLHGPVSKDEWSAARSAAWSAEKAAEKAAWSAARSAAESTAWAAAESAAARSAAWSAAESTAWAAAESAAARSAAWSAARSAAESTACIEIRDIVLDVLAEKEVV